MLGVKIDGSSGSVETATKGLELTNEDTSAINVTRTSLVVPFESMCDNILSRFLLVTQLILSHAPSKWE